VVATNTGGFRGHHLASELQGTGTYMGYEIGAVIKNPEFHYINVRPALHEIEGSGLFPNLGGRWINGKGEYFMSRYVPDLQDRAPTQALIIAMSLEARQGNLPISCDVENMSEEQRSQFSKLMVSHGWMPLLYEKMKSKGMDLLRQNYEWKPAYEGNKMGLDADINCATAVPGLYAAGMARTLGINSFTGWSIASSTWSGYTAGRKSTLYSQTEAPREPISTEEKLVLQEFAKPARNVEGIDPDDLILELQKVLFPYDVLILISEPSLHRALNQVHEIKAKLDRISCSDVHNLIKAYELKTMVFAAELSLKASLMRKETRPSLFYREDYPAQDDRNWLKWILVSKGKQGEPVFSTRIVNGRGLEGLE
jgi:succinate dehydrogenase/fumarate reductase flavoprotein subunit